MPVLPLYQVFEDPAHQALMVEFLKLLVQPQSQLPPAKKSKAMESRGAQQASSQATGNQMADLPRPCLLRINVLLLMSAELEKTQEQQTVVRALKSIKQLLTSDGDAIQQRASA